MKVYEINTAFGKLYYPERWKDKVTTKSAEKSVSFISDGVEVFALQLGGDKGFRVGKFNGADLRLVTFEFDKKKLSAARYDELCAMQEDANVVLEYLEKETAFSAE